MEWALISCTFIGIIALAIALLLCRKSSMISRQEEQGGWGKSSQKEEKHGE